MRKLILIALTMSACVGGGDSGQSCDAFRGTTAYVVPDQPCLFDLSDVDYTTLSDDPDGHPIAFVDNGGSPTGDRQPDGSWRLRQCASWTKDPGAIGMAFIVGPTTPLDNGFELAPDTCQWVRATTVL